MAKGGIFQNKVIESNMIELKQSENNITVLLNDFCSKTCNIRYYLFLNYIDYNKVGIYLSISKIKINCL